MAAFTFSAESFNDSPFLRTELIELESDCEALRDRCGRLQKGISRYLCAPAAASPTVAVRVIPAVKCA